MHYIEKRFDSRKLRITRTRIAWNPGSLPPQEIRTKAGISFIFRRKAIEAHVTHQDSGTSGKEVARFSSAVLNGAVE
jgi:hypothetical protein